MDGLVYNIFSYVLDIYNASGEMEDHRIHHHLRFLVVAASLDDSPKDIMLQSRSGVMITLLLTSHSTLEH